MNGIPILLDEQALSLGIEKWIQLDYSLSPHLLWAGRTRSGKSVAAKICLARTILLAPPELQPIELTVVDPKADIDFDYLDGLPRFYRGTDAPQGLSDFYDAFIRRKEKLDLSTNLKVIFVDEFQSLVNLLDGKIERETAQRKLNLLLTLSASRRFSVQLATQQPSAQMFGSSGTASREQFGITALLGDSGSETQQMIFGGDSRERIKEFGSIGGRGVGWLSLNGGLAQPVRVPFISNMDKLNAVIRNNLMENPQ
jgi:hypothetical protein